MNLHQLTPPQTRWVRAVMPHVADYDVCEWDVDGEDCDKPMSEAVMDTESPARYVVHGVDGYCRAHLCKDHIERGFQLALNSV